MSHSVVITLDNIKHNIEICNKYHSFFSNILNDEFVDANEIGKIVKDIEKYKQELLSMVGTSFAELNLVQSAISSISKKASNIYNNFSYVKNICDKISQQNELNITKEISENGTLAIQTIEYLEQNKLTINKVNFDKKLEEIRLTNINESKLNQFRIISYKLIMSSNIPDDIKNLLNIKIHTISNSQEFSEINPFLESKINEFNYVQSIIKTIVESLKFEKFDLKSITWTLDENQIIKSKLSLVNKNGNNVKIIINGDGVIRYKLGNYVGHACEKTSNRLFEDLIKNGYIIKDCKIKRECDESIPLAKEFINKDRSK